MAPVLLGDRNDQPQVGLDHPALGELVTLLDQSRQALLLVLGQKRRAADLRKVEIKAVDGCPGDVRRHLDRRSRLGCIDFAHTHDLHAKLFEFGAQLGLVLGGQIELRREIGQLCSIQLALGLGSLDDFSDWFLHQHSLPRLSSRAAPAIGCIHRDVASLFHGASTEEFHPNRRQTPNQHSLKRRPHRFYSRARQVFTHGGGVTSPSVEMVAARPPKSSCESAAISEIADPPGTGWPLPTSVTGVMLADTKSPAPVNFTRRIQLTPRSPPIS